VSKIADKIDSAFSDDEKLMDLYELFIKRDTSSYDANLQSLVDELAGALIADEAGRLTIEQDNIALLNRIEDTIQSYLASDETDKLRQQLINTLDERLDTINQFVIDAGLANLVIDQPKRINRIINAIDVVSVKMSEGVDWSQEEIRQLFLQVRGDIDTGTRISLSDFKLKLQMKGRVLPNYAKVVANTQLAAVDRIARKEQAKEGVINTMKYYGVLDGLTRPFCKRMVGQIKSIEEWESTYNDTGPQPAIDYCGGWNCRHRLIPYKPEWDN